MAPTLFSCNAIATAFISLIVRGVNAGFETSALSFATGLFTASMDGVKMALEDDAWVDTQITSSTPSLCKSLDECGWNRTSWNMSVLAYADIISSKRLLLEDALSEDAGIETPVALAAEESLLTPSPEAPVAASANADRLSLEAHAVRLSLLVGESCTESGPRQCWRNSAAETLPKGALDTVGYGVATTTTRKLRPVTISFGEPRGSGRHAPLSDEGPLVKSLNHFRFTSA